MKPRARSVYFSRFMRLPLFGLLRTPDRRARHIVDAKSPAVPDVRQERPRRGPVRHPREICGGRPGRTEEARCSVVKPNTRTITRISRRHTPKVSTNVLKIYGNFGPPSEAKRPEQNCGS